MTQEIGKVQVKTNSITANQDSGAIKVSVNSQNPQRVQSIQYFAGAETLQNISNQSNTAIALAAGSANTTAAAYATANAGYATANAGYETANAGYEHANSSYTKANIALSMAQAAFEEANTDFQEILLLWDQGNSSFSQANAAYATANASFDQANINYAISSASFDQANINYEISSAAFDQANINYAISSASFDQANINYEISSAAFDQANINYATSSAAFDTANIALDKAFYANTAWIQANAAYATGNAAYSTANAGYSTANAAYATSNAGYTTANTALSTGYNANTAWIQANSAYSTANVGYSTAGASYAHANASYTTANAGYSTANAAYSTANVGYSTANAAYAHANASYTNANTKVNKSGDVMTGNLVFEIAEAGYFNALTVSNTEGLQFVLSNNGDLTAYGQANVYQKLAVGTGAYFDLPDLIAQFTANAATYSQVNQQNINPDGSGDFVITSDDGTDLSNYTDLGKAGSNYNYYGEGATIKPHDSYLIAQGSDGQVEGSNLHIMATTSGHGDIVFTQGGAYEDHEVARFKYGKGLVIETQTASTSNSTGALVVEGGIGANGAIYADSVYIQNDNVANKLQSAFDQANNAYNTIFSTTPAWGHANAAYDHANAAFDAANNTTDAAQLYTDSVLSENVASANAYVNSAIAANVAVMNARITSNVLVINTSINRLNVYAQGAYATANAALANTTGTFGGTLTVSEAIKVGTYVDFNTDISSPTNVEGRVFYDNNQKALAYYNESSMTGQILQESVTRVWNNTGSLITDGMAVYINGASSANGFPSIALANSAIYESSEVIGITTTVMANGAYGYVTSMGKVNGLDTSLISEGSELYLSDTVPGGWSTTKPMPPSAPVRLGVVAASDAINGSILVDVTFRDGVNKTTGAILFARDETIFEDPDHLFWDYDNNRLGIGTDTPQANLHVVGTGLFTGNVTITGNLLVSNAQSITTTELTVGGNTIILNSELVGSPTTNAELIVNRGTENNVYIRWDESIKEWTMFEDAPSGKTGHILHSEKTAHTWADYSAMAPYEKDTHPIGASLANATNEHATAGYATANVAFATGYYANTAWNQANAAYAQGNTTITNTNSYITSNVLTINSSIDANVLTINSSIDANVSNLQSQIADNATSANLVIDTNISANVATLRGEITANAISANSVIDTNISANVATLRGEITSNTNSTLSSLRGEIATNSAANFAHANGAFNLANTSIQTLTGTDRVVVTQNDAHDWTVDLTTAATAGTYSYPQLQTDGYGRITSITSLTPVTTITSNGQLTFSRANGAVFAGLANVNSNIGSYGDVVNIPSITVDGFGRITQISNTPITSIETINSYITANAASANSVINTNISANVATLRGEITSNAASANAVFNSNISANVATLRGEITSNAASANAVFNTNISANVATLRGEITSNAASANAVFNSRISANVATLRGEITTNAASTNAFANLAFTKANSASLSTNVSVYLTTTNTGDTGTYYPLFASSSATGNNAPFADAGISYNASTNALTATSFVGQAVRANTAKYIETTAETAGNLYPLFAKTIATGNNITYSVPNIRFNGDTDTLYLDGLGGVETNGTLWAKGGQVIAQYGDEARLVAYSGIQNGAYLYSNLTDWGLYSASGGNLVYHNRSTGRNHLNGTAATLAQGGGTGAAMTFSYTATAGQPTGLWGTTNGTEVQVYNPSNFSVDQALNIGYGSRRRAANRAAAGPAGFSVFSDVGLPSLQAATLYEIEFYVAFLKTTAGTASWSFTFSSVPTNATIWTEMSAITGSGTNGTWAASLQGVLPNQSAGTITLPATGSLTTAVNHFARFRISVQTNAAAILTLTLTQSAGTATPLAGSYWRVIEVNHGIAG